MQNSENEDRNLCIECAEEISRAAKKCRHCGAYQRRYHRWSGPLVTILSLMVAFISLVVGARDQIENLIHPKTPIFAVLEDSNAGGRELNLVAQNESSDSLVVEDMECFMAFSSDPSESRFMDSLWHGDQSAIIAPGAKVSFPVQWITSADVFEAGEGQGTIPRASVSVRRWSSSCGCDPDRDIDEMIDIPVTVCRLKFRTSRRVQSHYDFRAPILDSSMREMIDGWDDTEIDATEAMPEEVSHGYNWFSEE